MLGRCARDGLNSREVDISVKDDDVSQETPWKTIYLLLFQAIHHSVHRFHIHLDGCDDASVLLIHQDAAFRSIMRQVFAEVDAVLANNAQRRSRQDGLERLRGTVESKVKWRGVYSHGYWSVGETFERTSFQRGSRLYVMATPRQSGNTEFGM